MSVIYPYGRHAALQWQNGQMTSLLSSALLRRFAGTSSSSAVRRMSGESGEGRGGDGGGDGEMEKKRKKIWTKDDVESAAAERRRHEEAIEQAKWVTSWMMPWERAQMDAPVRPLGFWERVYWRVFVVLGGVGFAYETWVLGNRRVLISSDNIQHKHYMKQQYQQQQQQQKSFLNGHDNPLIDKAPSLSSPEQNEG